MMNQPEIAQKAAEEMATAERPQVHAQLDRLHHVIAEMFNQQSTLEERLAMLIAPGPDDSAIPGVKDSISEEPWRISDQLCEAANSLEAIRRRTASLISRLEV